MDIVKLEKMYDERDDLECAVSLLKKASTCISQELESVQSDLAWVIETLEEELTLLEDSINGFSVTRRKGAGECI
jgi:hypothetical protein